MILSKTESSNQQKSTIRTSKSHAKFLKNQEIQTAGIRQEKHPSLQAKTTHIKSSDNQYYELSNLKYKNYRYCQIDPANQHYKFIRENPLLSINKNSYQPLDILQNAISKNQLDQVMHNTLINQISSTIQSISHNQNITLKALKCNSEDAIKKQYHQIDYQRFQDIQRTKQLRQQQLQSDISQINKIDLLNQDQWKSPYILEKSKQSIILPKIFKSPSREKQDLDKSYIEEETCQYDNDKMSILHLNQQFLGFGPILHSKIDKERQKKSMKNHKNISESRAMIKQSKKRNEAILWYNKLLQFQLLKKEIEVQKRINTPSSNFTLHTNNNSNNSDTLVLNLVQFSQQNLLSKEIFLIHFDLFWEIIRKEDEIVSRMLNALTKEQHYMTFDEFITFFKIFVWQSATSKEKTQFLIEFILNHQNETSFLDIQQILRILCNLDKSNGREHQQLMDMQNELLEQILVLIRRAGVIEVEKVIELVEENYLPVDKLINMMYERVEQMSIQ